MIHFQPGVRGDPGLFQMFQLRLRNVDATHGRIEYRRETGGLIVETNGPIGRLEAWHPTPASIGALNGIAARLRAHGVGARHESVDATPLVSRTGRVPLPLWMTVLCIAGERLSVYDEHIRKIVSEFGLPERFEAESRFAQHFFSGWNYKKKSGIRFLGQTCQGRRVRSARPGGWRGRAEFATTGARGSAQERTATTSHAPRNPYKRATASRPIPASLDVS